MAWEGAGKRKKQQEQYDHFSSALLFHIVKGGEITPKFEGMHLVICEPQHHVCS